MIGSIIVIIVIMMLIEVNQELFAWPFYKYPFPANGLWLRGIRPHYSGVY